MPFIDTRGIFGPAGVSYSDSRYNNQNDYDTWTDPKVISVDNGINSATGLPFTRGDFGFGDYTSRADANGRAEVARQAAEDDDGFMGLGDIGTLAMLAAAIYSGGSALGAWGAGAGATGASGLAAADAMAGLIPAGELGAWAGTAGAGLGSLANTGYIDALGGLTDATGTALSGWGDIATTAGTAAGTAGGVQTVADLGYVDTLGGMGGGVAGGVEGGIGGASIGAGGMEAGLPAFAGGAGEISPTLLSQLNTALGTNFTGTDVMRTLGNLSAAGLGAYASSEQTGALDEMAKRYEGYGAPYRQKLSDLYANPESFLSSKEVQTPVDLGTKSLMRSLSVTGNPFGSGNALTEGQNYASNKLFSRLGEEKDRLAGYGGITTYNAAAPTAATNAIGSSANTYNAIGSGLGNIFNPPKTESQTMADFIKALRG